MEKAQPNSNATSASRIPQQDGRRSACSGQLSGRLAGLAALINNSPRVQYQHKLAAELQGSRVVQMQMKKAMLMNAAVPAEKKLAGTQPFQLQGATEQPAKRTGSPEDLKAGVENLSHLLLDDVKVHYNSSEPVQHFPDREAMERSRGLDGALHEPIVQGKWFRMSILIDAQDASEIAEIQRLVDSGEFFEAFWLIVSKYPGLADDFQRILAKTGNDDIFNAAYHILQGTFNAPKKEYTAAEVIELLEGDETVSQEPDEKWSGMGMLTENEIEDPGEEWDEEVSGMEIESEGEAMESLISEFSKLTINVPFYSDADGEAEEHLVFPDGGEVMVKSNPKPLKEITKAKKWLGISIPGPTVTQLEALRKIAKRALYQIAGKAKHKIVGARTKANMKTFRKALEDIAKVLQNLRGAAHTASLLPKTDLSTSTNHGANASPIEGTKVIAKPLSINSGSAGSAPHDGRLMTSIRNLAGTQSKSYVQMHLLNDLVFGPGELWNLTPGPKQSNVDMENNVEDPLKRAVLGKGLVIDFEAQVNYNHDPISASQKDIDQNPDKYRFQSISFKAEQKEYDSGTKTWKTAGAQDPDVSSVDGATVNWRYGSLTPLTPKPRILDAATTVAELIAAGIQPAAAQRIHDWVAAGKPGWTVGGKDKQKKLAEAVKAYDHRKTKPNITSWKATAVLWT